MSNGEAYFKNVDGEVLISTNNDKFTPAKDIYLSRARYYEKKDNKMLNIRCLPTVPSIARDRRCMPQPFPTS